MPASNAPGTFAAAPLDETVRALVRLIRRERPHVVVTYPANQRGYRHPDHLRVHDASLPAYRLARDPGFHPELGSRGRRKSCTTSCGRAPVWWRATRPSSGSA